MKIVSIALALLFASTTAFAQTTWWKPTVAGEWQWMIAHPLNINSAADMGTGKVGWNGAKPPGTDPSVYDIDGWDNPATTVAALHARQLKVICYIEIGAAETYRADYSQFPASTLGKTMDGYAQERYIDIRNATVVSIIKARIKMCADKHFDAIEPDIDGSYNEDTGFPLTQADQLTFMTTLSDYAHSLGVAFFTKNCTVVGGDYCAKVAPLVDGAVIEECNAYGECGPAVTAFAGKAVFNAEYRKLSLSKFCPKDNARANWNGTLFNVNLDNRLRTPCK